MTFELAWKTLKDYLESLGFQVNSPREVIKQSYQSKIIGSGHTWMEALDDRNLTAHTYDETTSQEIETLIRDKYFAILAELYDTLKNKIKNEFRTRQNRSGIHAVSLYETNRA